MKCLRLQTTVCRVLWAAFLCCFWSATANGQADLSQLSWHRGPKTVAIGSVAELRLPSGYWCLNDAADVRALLENSQLLYDPSDLAIIVPDLDSAPNDRDFWSIMIKYEDIGYVKDDEKDRLNNEGRDALLQSITDATNANNVEFRNRGWRTLHVDGWQTPPFYDDVTKNLTWSILAHSSQGNRLANYNSKLLGRNGVMAVDLVIDPSTVDRTIPTYQNLVSRISFVSGQKYAELKQGDRMAPIGLIGLISGVTAAKAVNWKVFAKLGAAILAVLCAIGVWIRSKLSAWFPSTPKPATAGVGAETDFTNAAASDAPTVVKCRVCGQKNRTKPGGAQAVCGRCGANLS